MIYIKGIQKYDIEFRDLILASMFLFRIYNLPTKTRLTGREFVKFKTEKTTKHLFPKSNGNQG